MADVTVDVECYQNYFLVVFKGVKGSRKTLAFDMYNDSELNCRAIIHVLENNRTIGFNSINYDLPMITLALSGASNMCLKSASDAIIQCDLKPWQFEKRYGIRVPYHLWEHVDLIEVAPGVATSLKLYGGRMHSKRLQDLPIDPTDYIMPEQCVQLREYCVNDNDTTADLWNKLQSAVSLRGELSERYGLNLMSKSDAQIAEAVIKQAVEAKAGFKVKRSDAPANWEFKYTKPTWLKSFVMPQLNEALASVEAATFKLSDKNVVVMPDELSDLKISIGNSVYRMGIGGLHSSESAVSHYSDDKYVLRDHDVASYYPASILNQGLYPSATGEAFIDIYRAIRDERIEAKRAGDKSRADSLKITLNGTYGKLGSPYSFLFAPHLMIQVTITGQLALLKLIELIEMREIPVISANTDGIVIKCPRHMEGEVNRLIKHWESVTGYETEETRYKSVHSRDVNNYVAIKEDGSVKTKGVFGFSGLMKNPANEICAEAVVAYLKDNIPVEKTVEACSDVRKFLTVRTVKGGAVHEGRYIGKVIRWYYTTDATEPIVYKTNGNQVPRTDMNVRTLMELPDDNLPPADLNRTWYIKEALSMLSQLGLDKPV